MIDLQGLWEKALSKLEKEVSVANFKTWFSDLYIQKEDNGVIYISTPSEFIREWIVSKYSSQISKVIREIAPEVRSIEYVIARRKNNRFLNKVGHGANELPISNIFINRNSNLNPRYTFENYIIGGFNELAYATAQAIVMKPGTYNPFFIYGETGLGKTHIIQAIGNQLLKNDENLKIIYITSEKFVQDLVSALKTNSMEYFKEKYRKYDVFIMDDIQFIAGKERSQEELFHLFNVLYDQKKQIIFSSDKHPNFIPNLESRLRSRFSAGMIVDIERPDYESRYAIIKQKVDDLSLGLTEEMIEYIAKNVEGNIRELEGVINSLSIKIQLNPGASLQTIQSVIKNNIKPKRNISISEVVDVVCEFYNIDKQAVYDKNRRKEVVKARQIVMYILREFYNISFPHIGRELGNRDHTTVMHSYQKVKGAINDPEVSSHIEQIRSMLATK